MKGIVDAKAFSKALDKVSKATSREMLPILDEVHVRFHDGQCVLSATDLNTWLITRLPAQGDDFAFVFSRTKDVAKACRHFDGELSMELTETGDAKNRCLRLTMRSGSRAGEFYALPPEDYPELWKPDAGELFTVDAASLSKRIERIGYAARKESMDLARSDLSSIQFVGNQIYSLDGYRAAGDTDTSLAVAKPFLVPKKSLAYLKVFGDSIVTMRVGTRHALITDGSTELHVRLVEAPPYMLSGAIPQNYREEFYVSPEAFLHELTYLKEAAPNEKRPCVKFSAGALSMSALTGKYAASVELDGKSEIVFGFDLRYMMDALRQFKKEPWVKMKISGANSPIIIEAEGRTDFAFVLPTRLRSELAA